MKQKIVFCGVLNLYTGYGQHSCKIISGLDKMGYDMYVRPVEIAQTLHDQQLILPPSIFQHFVQRVQQEPWEILLTPPKLLPTRDKKTLYYTMWESTRLSRKAVDNLNKAEVVVVPCKWNEKAMLDSGVERPVRVVPLGIYEDEFCYHSPPKNDRFVFGCAGRIAHGDQRKGLKDVIRAFKAAFPPHIKDVCLQVKGFQDCPINNDSEDKRIELHQRYFTPIEYVRWLAGLNCFVSAAKAEGWGWHQQEAMAVGRPLIACKYGGMAEFFDETCGICVPYTEVPAQEIWAKLGMWAQPSFDGMVDAMRYMYLNPGQCVTRGLAASRKARRFTVDYANEKLVEVMKEFGALH